MADAPETIDIFSARPGDIVIYSGYSSSEALRDACFVGIYQGFEYWTPDERPLELWVQMIGRNKDDLGMEILVSASQVIHTDKGNEGQANTQNASRLRCQAGILVHIPH